MNLSFTWSKMMAELVPSEVAQYATKALQCVLAQHGMHMAEEEQITVTQLFQSTYRLSYIDHIYGVFAVYKGNHHCGKIVLMTITLALTGKKILSETHYEFDGTDVFGAPIPVGPAVSTA